MKDELIRKVIASVKCGSCGQNYEGSRVEIIERNDELWFLKVICSSCHVGCMVAAIIRKDNRPALVTDLTEAEIDKFRRIREVNADDVLDMHEFLKNFDGDFPGIFRE